MNEALPGLSPMARLKSARASFVPLPILIDFASAGDRRGVGGVELDGPVAVGVDIG